MGRAPCCDKSNVKKGPWSPEEDAKLKEFIEKFGTGGNWIALPQKAGLKRCGKSCRLRWLNYLRPNIKHGEFSDEEDRIICALYANIGSRWSIIAAQLPGRTDNDIKNYWNTKLKKKLMGLNIPLLNQAKFSQSPLFSTNYNTLQAQLSQPLLSSLSQLYNDNNNNYNSFYFQSPKSLPPTIESLSAPQNSNFLPSTCNNFSLSTPQTSYYYQQNQDQGLVDYQYNNNNNNMLIFGGNNEPSCTSSSDGSCSQISYSKEHHHVIKQEDQMAYFHQGFNLSDHQNQKFLFQYGKNNQVDQLNASGILENSQIQCDLEEVKQLIVSSGHVMNNGDDNNNNNNNCNSLLFNDENKTHEKGLYFNYY